MNIAVLFLAAALSAGNAEFDETARSGAYEIAVGRYVDEVSQKGPEEGLLAKAMLSDPAAFASADASKDKARELYFKLVADAVEAERGKIAQRLGISDSDSAGAMPAFADRQREAAQKSFDARYAAERKAACEAQAKELVGATRPSEAEVEEMSDADLAAKMTERIVAVQASPVFEENRSYISEKMVKPVIESAREEQRHQREYVKRARSEAASPSKMAEEFMSRLAANVGERAKGKSADMAWGVFPSVVSKTLPEAVERRMVERLASRVEGVKVSVSVEDVMKEIESDPQGHVKASESERRFFEAYSAGALTTAFSDAVSDAPEADRPEVESYLRDRLHAGPVSKAVERLVRREVMPKWREARREAADRMAAEIWPSLDDRTWYPPAELADETAARSDYASAVSAWRRMDGMSALASASEGKVVLEEAEAKADDAVAKAFDLARSAIAAQNAIVDGSHAEVLAVARERKESFWRRTPTMKDVADMLTRATEEKWTATRVATLWPEGDAPSNASEQHRELFPSVRRKIELLSKLIIEEMEHPQPEEPTPEEQEELEEIALSVSRKDGKVEVSLKRGGEDVASESVPATAEDFKNAMRRMSDRISSDVLRLH